MGNMSYCRFENTLEALEDCREAMDEGGAEDLSAEEARARLHLINLFWRKSV